MSGTSEPRVIPVTSMKVFSINDNTDLESEAVFLLPHRHNERLHVSQGGIVGVIGLNSEGISRTGYISHLWDVYDAAMPPNYSVFLQNLVNANLEELRMARRKAKKKDKLSTTDICYFSR